MPHASLKLIPGADQNETPTLNEGGIQTTNLIRFIYDQKQGGLIQKLGGWIKFYGTQMATAVRALWAWEDTQGVSHLAVGTQGAAGTAALLAITNGVSQTITPQTTVTTPSLSFSTTAGSPVVIITDASSGTVTSYTSVYIPVQVAVGGIILFGLYPCNPPGYAPSLGSNQYYIVAQDTLQNPLPALTTSSSAAVPQLSATNNSSLVTVSLTNHGYSVGSTFPILIATTVGGILMQQHYPVQQVLSANSFTITGTTTAASTQSVYINSGNAYFLYNFGQGATLAAYAYGTGSYGSGTYGGVPTFPSLGTTITASNWTLDNWGEILLSCPIYTYTVGVPYFAPIYAWDSEGGSPIASALPYGPAVNDGIFVAMPQRQIIAWGSSFNGISDPLLVRWCDVNNYNVWIAQITNQAGSYRIPKGSKIVGCIQVGQQGLIFTDIGLWAMQYIGPPYVYSFNELGTGCGLISRKAVASLAGGTYWMGQAQFYTLGSGGVQPIPCPLWDVIFQNLDTSNLDKIRVAPNSQFGEIGWFYPTTTSGGEVSAYVKYNVNLGLWDYGNLARSAWLDQSVLGSPIGADPNLLYIYQHESSGGVTLTNADTSAMNSSFSTGYFTIADGDLKNFVDQVWPDMKWGFFNGSQNATVNLTFSVADYPTDTPQTFGPYTLTSSTSFISPRFRGRLVSISLSSNDLNSFWRIGLIRYRTQPDGKY